MPVLKPTATPTPAPTPALYAGAIRSLFFLGSDTNPTDIGGGHGWELAAVHSDGSWSNVSDGATWTSSDPAVATIVPYSKMGITGQQGVMVISHATGTTTITASYGGLSLSQVMTVGPARSRCETVR